MASSSHAAPRWASWLLTRLCTLTVIYGAALGLWLVARGLFGDRWWWLFMLNAFSIYLFVPLPVALLVALLARRQTTWLAALGATALLLWLYGELWLPAWPAQAPPGAQVRVMTYNMLGFTKDPARVVATIRQARADIVTIQELTPGAATLIQRDLHDDYPYQALEPRGGIYGMGVISRLPLRASATRLPGQSWPIPPQILTVDLAGRDVTLINVHPYATTPGPIDYMEETIRVRELQTSRIAETVARERNPVLMPIDFNATDQNINYATIRQVMGDAWRAAGTGLGHTFPSNAPAGWSVGGVQLPWLVRIDYVFYSPHWTALNAELGPWDGASDHRPVIADLVLRTQP